MERRSSIICGWVLAVAVGVLWGLWASIAQANDVENSVTVSTSSPPPAVGFNEGGGDGLNWTGTSQTKRLKVTLNAPANKEIKCASQTVISEGIAWDCEDWDTWAASHLYTSALITPKDFFRPQFSGPIRGGAGGPGGGGPPPTWYAGVIQADIQADADNDSTTAQRPPATADAERKEEEVAEQAGTGNTTGLIIPVNDNYHEGGTGAIANIDYTRAGVVTSDPDLVQGRLVLKLPTEVVPDSKIKLTYDNSKLLVYRVSGGSATVITSGNQADVSSFGTDATLLLEGVAASSSSGGNSIQVTLTPKSGDVSRDKLIATVVKIDLDIYSGAGRAGAALIARTLAPETNHDTDELEDEEDLGAFAVANLNNTNGNLSGGADVVDLNETNVVGTGTRGYDEVDLLQLRLQRPTPTDLPGHVRVQIVSGNVKIWPDATKTGDELTGDALTKAVNEGGGFWSANNDHDWFVEVNAATALQGIKLKYEYRPKADGQWMAAPSDAVAATGIWAEHEAVPGTNPIEHLAGATELNIWFRVYPNNLCAAVGTPPVPLVPTHYGDGTTPCRPLFDVTRQVQGGLFRWPADVPGGAFNQPPEVVRADSDHVLYCHFPENLPETVPVPPPPHTHPRIHNEYANDDDARVEEPNPAGYLVGYDWPQHPATPTEALTVMRANFKEFVRVRFDGTDPGPGGNLHEENDGSRCSVFALWHATQTDGLVSAAQAGTGHVVFAREAIHTAAVPTAVVGRRHHAVCRGLILSAGTGAGAQSQDIELKEDDTLAGDDLLHTIAATVIGRMDQNDATPPPPKDDQTQVNDHLAYIAVGYFVCDKDGKIRGPEGTSDEAEDASLYHEIVIPGDPDPESPRTEVDGAPFPYTLREDAVPNPLTKGAASAVQISGAIGANPQRLYVQADSNAGGTQDVTVRLVDDDGAGYNTLVRFDLQLARQMEDEKDSSPVTAVIGGGLQIPQQTAYVGAKSTGEIGGKDGWSGEGVPGNRCDFAVRIDSDGKETSPSRDRFGPTYSPPAAAFTKTTIPLNDTSTMTMSEVYTHATGTTGNQMITVDIRDEDVLGFSQLDQKTIDYARPANCFSGMLIGPASTSSTLTNTNHIVVGPLGSSGEQEAEVYYKIDDSQSSPTTEITAE